MIWGPKFSPNSNLSTIDSVPTRIASCVGYTTPSLSAEFALSSESPPSKTNQELPNMDSPTSESISTLFIAILARCEKVKVSLPFMSEMIFRIAMDEFKTWGRSHLMEYSSMSRRKLSVIPTETKEEVLELLKDLAILLEKTSSASYILDSNTPRVGRSNISERQAKEKEIWIASQTPELSRLVDMSRVQDGLKGYFVKKYGAHDDMQEDVFINRCVACVVGRLHQVLI
jgi:hypothetical protein